jgi:hypothetical protein
MEINNLNKDALDKLVELTKNGSRKNDVLTLLKNRLKKIQDLCDKYPGYLEKK